jgi:hypothetical protein
MVVCERDRSCDEKQKLAWVRQIHLDTVNQDHPLLKSGDQ